jgi:hypothetical protein
VIAARTLAPLLLLAAACTGDSAAGTPQKAGKTTSGSIESSGDVVIRAADTPYTPSAISAMGSVTGAVTFKNAPEAHEPAPTGRDSTICGPSIPDESTQLRAVVWLEGVRTGKSIGLERRVELESDHCKLTPRVQAAVVGSAVNIIGHDNLMQHLTFQASGEASPRATILLGGGEQVIPTELPFKTPGMVAVRDTGHVWTRAYLAVFDHPYFAVTSATGTFTIDSVPPGKYTLHAWHERGGVTTQSLDVPANGAATAAIVFLDSAKP